MSDTDTYQGATPCTICYENDAVICVLGYPDPSWLVFLCVAHMNHNPKEDSRK